MQKLVIAAIAATIALAATPLSAREVQLTDREKSELRDRADRVKQRGANDGTSVQDSARDMRERAGTKVHKAKAKTKHKARKAKRKVTSRTG